MNVERAKLIEEIHSSVFEKYKAANLPIIFKTADCAENEFAGKNPNTGKVTKLKVVSNDQGTMIFDLDLDKRIV